MLNWKFTVLLTSECCSLIVEMSDWILKTLQLSKLKIPFLEISSLICHKCLDSYCRCYLLPGGHFCPRIPFPSGLSTVKPVSLKSCLSLTSASASMGKVWQTQGVAAQQTGAPGGTEAGDAVRTCSHSAASSQDAAVWVEKTFRNKQKQSPGLKRKGLSSVMLNSSLRWWKLTGTPHHILAWEKLVSSISRMLTG